MSESHQKITLKCTAFRPLRKNTLVGFAEIYVAAMKMTIVDIGIHAKGESKWVQLPARPQLRDGMLVRDDQGKGQYVALMQFDNSGTRNAFSQATVAAVLAFAPDAFDTVEATP